MVGLLSLFVLLLTGGTRTAKAQNAPQAAVPVILPVAGQYDSAQTVTITDSTPGAAIYYTVDERSPLTTRVNPTPVLYTGPFTVSSRYGASVDAYATAPGYSQSRYAQSFFDLVFPPTAAPSISLPGGVYSGPQTVTLNDATANATIVYTLDGSSPYSNPNRLSYTGPITVSSDATLAAIAFTDATFSSAVSRAQYILSDTENPFIYTLAGSGRPGYSGDAGLATQAELNNSTTAVRDNAGNIFIADAYNYVIRKVAAGTGIISTYAGTGTPGYSGDGGPASQATLGTFFSIAVDAAGNLYVADQGADVVRKITASTGIISTVAGNGVARFRYTGDGGPASAASLYGIQAIALDHDNNLYISDLTCALRKVTASTGLISTVLGGMYCGNSGDGGPAAQASIGVANGLAVDAAGDLFLATTAPGDAGEVRKIDAGTGLISAVAGHSPGNAPTPGSPQLATNVSLGDLYGVAVNAAGDVFFVDRAPNAILRVDAKTGLLSNVTSTLSASCETYGGDGGPAIHAGICGPQGLFLDSAGNLLFTDAGTRVRQILATRTQPTVAAAAPVFSIAAGTYDVPQVLTLSSATPGAAFYVTLDGSTPSTLSTGYHGPISLNGNVTVKAVAAAPGFLASAPVEATYQITATPPTVISTVAGKSQPSLTQFNVPATSTYLNTVESAATDSKGNVYFSTPILDKVLKVTSDGTLVAVAGDGQGGPTQDNVPALQTSLLGVQAIALDKSGNLFLSANNGVLVRKVSVETGLITTIAGQLFPTGQLIADGDGGPATAADLGNVQGLAIDASGNVVLADIGFCRIRRIDATTGVIHTIYGNGTCSHSGDGGPASSAGLNPAKIAFAANGDLYIQEMGGNYIRRVAADTGIITTIAGNGNLSGASGDGGPALNAEIDASNLVIGPDNNVYITDFVSNTVREINTTTGVITSVVGNGYPGFSGDGGAASMASLFSPSGLAFDSAGNLFIADRLNARIRKVSAPVPVVAPFFSPAAGAYTGTQTVTITDAVAGAVIHFTTDGSLPGADSPVYTDPVTLSSTTTLRALALAPGSQPSAVASAAYTIRALATPALTVSPAIATIAPTQTLALVVDVSGSPGGAAPTGTLSLTAGHIALQANLTQSGATFQLVPGSLPVGSSTVAVRYSGDANYAAVAINSSVSVVQLSASAAQPVLQVAAGSATATNISLAASSGYAGTVKTSCTMTSSPAGAQVVPACSLNPQTLTLSSGAGAVVLASVTTTASAATQAGPLQKPGTRGTGLVVFASLLFFSLPKRRRSLFANLSLCVAFSLALAGCTGSSGQSTRPVLPSTSPGSYTFTVAAVDAANAGLTASTTFTVQVK